MKKNKKALDFINQIQKIRSNNNSNWMDILRLGFKHDPKKASKIMSQIYIDDQKISKYLKKINDGKFTLLCCRSFCKS
jgi:hypothetical protein